LSNSSGEKDNEIYSESPKSLSQKKVSISDDDMIYLKENNYKC
jgi:hypothetical protein